MNVSCKPAAKGYTLLETVVSLGILMAVVVPLVTMFYQSTIPADAARELEGTWLIEQEATLVGTFPRKSLPIKRRYIDGREWTITTDITTGPVCRYRLSAVLAGREKALAVFYGRNDAEKH